MYGEGRLRCIQVAFVMRLYAMYPSSQKPDAVTSPMSSSEARFHLLDEVLVSTPCANTKYSHNAGVKPLPFNEFRLLGTQRQLTYFEGRMFASCYGHLPQDVLCASAHVQQPHELPRLLPVRRKNDGLFNWSTRPKTRAKPTIPPQDLTYRQSHKLTPCNKSSKFQKIES